MVTRLRETKTKRQGQDPRKKEVTTMTNIAINEKKHTIELTKKDYDKACKFGTQEYLDLQEVRKAYPNYKVVKVTRKASKNTYKGLTYAYMEKYIKAHDNEEQTISATSSSLLYASEPKKATFSSLLSLVLCPVLCVSSWKAVL